MDVLLGLVAVVLLLLSLSFILRRVLGRRDRPAPHEHDERRDARPARPSSTGWTRQDRLALASLVTGTLLGVLALTRP